MAHQDMLCLTFLLLFTCTWAWAEQLQKERPSWMLDVKKAKSLLRFQNDGKVLLRRRKRWGIKSLWGEEQEEEEESENNREQACRSRCWSSWGESTSCSVRCGTSGERIRYRTVVRTDCSCPGLTYRVEQCGNSCQNGGTPNPQNCACTPGYQGDCCATRVTCGNPGSPPHGSVIPSGSSHNYNIVVQYSCEPGWELTGGHSSRRCQNNGQWSGSVPGCTRVRCPHPGTPANGAVAPDAGYVFETLAQFSCNPGFNLQGSETTQCLSTRLWSHSPPQCDRISCGDPGQISNGIVTGNGFRFEDTLTYSCDAGFTLIGSSERQCVADGTWSCDTPRCVSSVSLIPRCTSLNQINFGSVTTTNDNYYQSVAEYSCEEGYYLSGNSHRACRSDQHWSGTEPSCNRITCRTLTAPANGRVTQPAGTIEYGSQASYTCNSGYWLDGNDVTTCQGTESEGIWSATPPQCQAVDCGTPMRPDNGRIVGTDFTFQHSVTVECGAGFFLRGSPQLTCNENSVWISDESPSCIPCPLDFYKSQGSSATSCTRCPDNSHTVSTTSTSLIQCICDTGYQGPDGGPCTIISCSALPSPGNGTVDPCGNVYQSVCNLRCNSGFIVTAGDLTRQCQASGFWNNEPLRCSACPRDTYQNETYTCRRCPDNSVTAREASVFSDCTCAAGFEESGGTGQECEDIDECSGSHPCQQECINTIGSFRCGCVPGWSLNGRPEDNPTNCIADTSNCPEADLIPPVNGGYVCGVVNVFEEYCSAYCNPDHEFLDQTDAYISCTLQTGWQWSHVLSGLPPPVCALILFGIQTYQGSISYFGAECLTLTEEEKDAAKISFIEKLESNGVCWQEESGSCQVESVEITCGETFDDSGFGRKKRQANDNTLNVLFNLTINVDYTECSEVNCQEKFDKLVQTEEERIRRELEAGIQPYEDDIGCEFCINSQDSGKPLQMDLNGQTRVTCPDGYQRKGYSCRKCGVGMFHNKETGLCELCPAGEYQTQEGQTSCLSCPYLTTLGKRGAKKCPVPPEDTVTCQQNNPCLAGNNARFKGYYPHPDATKYVQCAGQSGRCFERNCPPRQIWNPRTNNCGRMSEIELSDIY